MMNPGIPLFIVPVNPNYQQLRDQVKTAHPWITKVKEFNQFIDIVQAETTQLRQEQAQLKAQLVQIQARLNRWA